ncbi:MAG: hypothetical protein M3347_11430 [Armatimonadota bacterium]|nr:hypothetical protein [Armatimonadota bacterium]
MSSTEPINEAKSGEAQSGVQRPGGAAEAAARPSANRQARPVSRPEASRPAASKPEAPKAAAFDPSEERRGEKVGALMMSARLALRRGRKDEARKLLQQVFVLNPTDVGAFELLGDIFLEEAEQGKAIEVLQRGLKHHPGHRSLEEKLALAHVDLAEMEHDRIEREQLLEHGDRDKWLDLQPNKAFGLSLLLPGAGQVYVDNNERAAAFFIAAIGFFCAWFIPFTTALKAARLAGKTNLIDGISYVFAKIGPPATLMLCLLFAAWIATYFVAAFDAMRSAEYANAERRHRLGL